MNRNTLVQRRSVADGDHRPLAIYTDTDTIDSSGRGDGNKLGVAGVSCGSPEVAATGFNTSEDSPTAASSAFTSPLSTGSNNRNKETHRLEELEAREAAEKKRDLKRRKRSRNVMKVELVRCCVPRNTNKIIRTKPDGGKKKYSKKEKTSGTTAAPKKSDAKAAALLRSNDVDDGDVVEDIPLLVEFYDRDLQYDVANIVTEGGPLCSYKPLDVDPILHCYATPGVAPAAGFDPDFLLKLAERLGVPSIGETPPVKTSKSRDSGPTTPPRRTSPLSFASDLSSPELVGPRLSPELNAVVRAIRGSSKYNALMSPSPAFSAHASARKAARAAAGLVSLGTPERMRLLRDDGSATSDGYGETIAHDEEVTPPRRGTASIDDEDGTSVSSFQQRYLHMAEDDQDDTVEGGFHASSKGISLESPPALEASQSFGGLENEEADDDFCFARPSPFVLEQVGHGPSFGEVCSPTGSPSSAKRKSILPPASPTPSGPSLAATSALSTITSVTNLDNKFMGTGAKEAGGGPNKKLFAVFDWSNTMHIDSIVVTENKHEDEDDDDDYNFGLREEDFRSDPQDHEKNGRGGASYRDEIHFDTQHDHEDDEEDDHDESSSDEDTDGSSSEEESDEDDSDEESSVSSEDEVSTVTEQTEPSELHRIPKKLAPGVPPAGYRFGEISSQYELNRIKKKQRLRDEAVGRKSRSQQGSDASGSGSDEQDMADPKYLSSPMIDTPDRKLVKAPLVEDDTQSEEASSRRREVHVHSSVISANTTGSSVSSATMKKPDDIAPTSEDSSFKVLLNPSVEKELTVQSNHHLPTKEMTRLKSDLTNTTRSQSCNDDDDEETAASEENEMQRKLNNTAVSVVSGCSNDNVSVTSSNPDDVIFDLIAKLRSETERRRDKSRRNFDRISQSLRANGSGSVGSIGSKSDSTARSRPPSQPHLVENE